MTSPEDADVVTTPKAQAFYVPRLLRQAEVVCADGRVQRGRVFLPAAAESHTGALRMAEWLEEPGCFFPFLPDGEGRPVLLSKEQLIVVTVTATTEDEVADAVVRKRVRVECGVLRLEGEVTIYMPASHSRVLDLLNRPGDFLALRSGDHNLFVRKSRIVRVTESGAPRA
jgi:hypothetical protein